MRELEALVVAVLAPYPFAEVGNPDERVQALIERAYECLDELGIDELSSTSDALLKSVRNEGTYAEKIASISVDLGLEADPIARGWLDFVKDRGWVRWAHRDPVGGVRPLDAQFRETFDRQEAVLDRVLERFEFRFAEKLEVLGALSKIASPTRNDLNRLKKTLPLNLVALEHFFDNLDSPTWMEGLLKDGFFRRLPEIEVMVVDGQQLVRTPAWPQSGYLRRMAEFGASPS
jgi:hypothetical protein